MILFSIILYYNKILNFRIRRVERDAIENCTSYISILNFLEAALSAAHSQIEVPRLLGESSPSDAVSHSLMQSCTITNCYIMYHLPLGGGPLLAVFVTMHGNNLR